MLLYYSYTYYRPAGWEMSTSASIIIYQPHFRYSRGCTCRKVKVYTAETDNLKGLGRVRWLIFLKILT